MLALGDLLDQLGLEALTGRERLSAGVRWVHSSELLDPTPWLSGGELLLTTGLAHDDAEQQRAYVARLHAHGVAGIGFGIGEPDAGFRYAALPEPLRAAADELDLPLFVVPFEMPFLAIAERAASHTVNEQHALLQRAVAAHERLERIVLSERGLTALVAELSRSISGRALIFDGVGEPLAPDRPPLAAPELAALRTQLGRRAGEPAPRAFAPGGALAGRALAVPVPRAGAEASAQAAAWLVAVKPAGELGRLDRAVVRQAATVVALELLRRRVADQTVRRLAGDVVAALLAGELEGGELVRRLEPFGLRGRVGVLVLAPPQGMQAQAADALAAALQGERDDALVGIAGPHVVALLGASDADDELFARAERLRAEAQRRCGLALAAGAGRAGPAAEVRRSCHEARCALEARALAAPVSANGAHHDPAVATYRDLGSFQLLLSLQDDDALRLFCDSVLAPVEQAEGAYGGELMRSLEAFIECNGQWERAARQLSCHRHTLRYRIQRIEQISGRSLGSARDRIDFWLALRGRELTG